MSESRAAKLNAIMKWMIIQFYHKVKIRDLCAINEKKNMHRKRSETLMFIFREQKKRENNTEFLHA